MRVFSASFEIQQMLISTFPVLSGAVQTCSEDRAMNMISMIPLWIYTVVGENRIKEKVTQTK